MIFVSSYVSNYESMHTRNFAVCDDHLFKDEKLFFRFRKDDGTYQEPADSPVIAKGQRIYSKWVFV